MDHHPDLERGDQNKSDSTQSIGAKVSEERLQAESLQSTFPNTSDNGNSTSIPGGLKRIPALVDISPRLDENNLLDGRPVFLSPKQLGLSEPSHGIAVFLSLMAQSMFSSAVGQFVHSRRRTNSKRTCFTN
jgi:hypothetical protein